MRDPTLRNSNVNPGQECWSGGGKELIKSLRSCRPERKPLSRENTGKGPRADRSELRELSCGILAKLFASPRIECPVCGVGITLEVVTLTRSANARHVHGFGILIPPTLGKVVAKAPGTEAEVQITKASTSDGVHAHAVANVEERNREIAGERSSHFVALSVKDLHAFAHGKYLRSE